MGGISCLLDSLRQRYSSFRVVLLSFETLFDLIEQEYKLEKLHSYVYNNLYAERAQLRYAGV